MPHILVAGKIHESGLTVLRRAPGVTLDVVEAISMESYAPLVVSADALLIRTQPMPAAVIATAPRLKIVSRHGVGYDAVDVPALTRRGIPLTIVGDVNSVSVAEHTLMLMLSLAKQTLTHDAATRGEGWNHRNEFNAYELSGKRLLVLGFGRIGRHVTRLARAFGMTVEAYDPFAGRAGIQEGGAEPVDDIGTALSRADVVSVHMPRSDGKAEIGTPELSLMKSSAIVINTSRGGIVDEKALFEALEKGRLAGAGLDVFETEPPPRNHPLLSSGRVIVSPHIAGLTQESAERMSISAARNILDFFAGKLDPALVVNFAALPAGAIDGAATS